MKFDSFSSHNIVFAEFCSHWTISVACPSPRFLLYFLFSRFYMHRSKIAIFNVFKLRLQLLLTMGCVVVVDCFPSRSFFLLFSSFYLSTEFYCDLLMLFLWPEYIPGLHLSFTHFISPFW